MIIKKNTRLGCWDSEGKLWKVIEITSGRVELTPVEGPKIRLIVSKAAYKENYWSESTPLIV